ncbi:MAG: TM2 domain-containing protein [Pirellulaceae bacterium]|nr:TM2 domain-containing protein [Pirellulaceae bacterium]
MLCPYCRTVLSVNAALVGVSLTCPNCNGVFQCPVLGTNAQDAPNGGAYPGSTYGSPPFQNVPYQGGPYGAPYGGPVHPVQAFASKKVAAGICGILIGGLGIHKFVLGFNTAGILMLLATVIGSVTGVCLIVPILAPMAMGVIGLIEGILYLTKSDEEFYQAYAIQRREWF